ncbi:3-dehydroquinate dehydratase [Burkholderia pseudomallei]|nr:3-dehydroquinate dehydratase [Burkholderia pseudomallei]
MGRPAPGRGAQSEAERRAAARVPSKVGEARFAEYTN